VLFVTHDIDEAVRLADRIAVLSVGGVLEQVADPATVPGAPASDFVADFVGSDRGLRRLAVTPITADDLEQPPTVSPADSLDHARSVLDVAPQPYAVVVDGDGTLRGWVGAREAAGGGTVADRLRPFDGSVEVGDPLRRALAEIVQHDAGWLPVLDGGRYLGVLTPGSVYTALRRSTPRAARD
jgi:osmoprotectant transport system ATP-binding protein